MQFDVHQNHQGYDFVAMAQARLNQSEGRESM